MGKWLSALKWLVVAVVLAVFIGLLIKWNRKGGISVEVGFDDRIKLTSQEIRRIEQIGQWEFLSVHLHLSYRRYSFIVLNVLEIYCSYIIFISNTMTL